MRKKSKLFSIGSVSIVAIATFSLIIAPNIFLNTTIASDNLSATTYTKGIDISHWQGTINWNGVYGDGYRFAFCKATEGITYDDPTFTTNMNGGTNAGVIMGAYHFAHPDSNSATSEAAHFVSLINEYMTDGYLRPVLDLEDGYTLGRTALTDWVLSFMTYVETQTGVEPLIYCNLNYANNYLDSRATAYDLWIARLAVSFPETGVWDDWTVWQYSWTGSVSGISGDVDLDYYNGDYSSLKTTLVIGGYEEIQYDRAAVYDYASTWWNDRNPLYFDYSDYGGDCANFVSQCIIAGGISLLEGTDGNGFGVDNYGTMPFCDYLNLNLRNYQDTSVTYIVEGSAYVPDEVTIGDVVIFGEDNADNWEHAMVVVSDSGNDVGLAGHSSNVWGRSFWTELGYSTFDCATFYHINSVIGVDDDTDNPATVYWPVLRSGSQGEDVRSLQYLLSARGYSLAIDGIFGSETESTVKAFQSDADIVVDGIVGSQTWSSLIITLKEGSSGDAVIALQRQLKFTYEYSLTIDGEFGPETRNTVIAFQNDAKIGVDGIVGPTTWKYVLGLKVGSTTGDTGDTGDPGDIPDDETVYWPTLRTGSQGEDVYTLQYLLTARGYSLAIDGIFGSETYNKVIAFQTARGLSVDGVVGPQTWTALVITLQEGSSGHAVTALQRQLKYTYWYSLDVDGDFGPETLSKVEAFQSDIGIDVDGIVGPITWRYLLGSESGSDAGDSSDSESVYWPTLRSGSQGEDVYTLQYLLTARGYSLAIDGSFGPETYSMVIAFQTVKGLSVDGVVGPQTWGALVITLQEGSSGPAVNALQRQLKNTFGYSLSVDGDFGPETLSKVEAFQSKAGIDVDGIVGPITWCYLLGLNGGTPAEDPEEPNVDDGSIAPWTRILKEGMNGNDVKELQIRIAGWATDSASQTYLALDGDFGPATKAALMRFQKAYGLTIDGIMGPETQAKLNSLEDSDKSTAHFAWSEFYSKDGSGFTGGSVSATEVKENVRRLMWKLEALRKKAGNNPITVTSGFRSISHNIAVGGASNSMHTYGIAADIKISGVSVATANSYARTCGFSGIIRYSTFNHVDSRMEYPYGAQFWYWATA